MAVVLLLVQQVSNPYSTHPLQQALDQYRNRGVQAQNVLAWFVENRHFKKT